MRSGTPRVRLPGRAPQATATGRPAASWGPGPVGGATPGTVRTAAAAQSASEACRPLLAFCSRVLWELDAALHPPWQGARTLLPSPAAHARSTRLQGTEALATVRELSPRLRLGKPQDCHVPLVCDVKENWEETGLFATWPVTNVLLCPECACPALTGGQSGRDIRAKNMLCTGQALRS